MNAQELMDLGFKQAGHKLARKESMKKKMAIAYEHYRFVSEGIMNRFQNALKEKTYKKETCKYCESMKELKKEERLVSSGLVYFSGLGCMGCGGSGIARETYDTLSFCSIGDYSQVPPQEVLDKVREAKNRRCFDSFEVAKVETVEVRPDPIIFGRIEGCSDRFFVAQWENDVKIEDILKENEG